MRIGKYAGNGPGLWLRMQAAHDLWHVEQEMAELRIPDVIETILEHPRAYIERDHFMEEAPKSPFG